MLSQTAGTAATLLQQKRPRTRQQTSTRTGQGTSATRTQYKCQACGQPKKGHVCTADSSLRGPVYSFSSTSPDSMAVSPSSQSSPDPSPSCSSRTSSTDGPTNSSSSGAGCSIAGEGTGRPVGPTTVLPPVSNLNDYRPSQFTAGWFDMTISGVDYLLTHLSSASGPSWSKNDEVVEHLKEERSRLTQWMEQFKTERSNYVKDTIRRLQTSEMDQEVASTAAGSDTDADEPPPKRARGDELLAFDLLEM